MKHKRSRYLIPAQTPEQVRAAQERKRSGAAGTHADRRTKRTRTRATAQAAALKGW